MAARLDYAAAKRLRHRHQDEVREKIKVSNIIDRLEKHIDGLIELTATQVASARILLDKSLPSVNAVELSGDPDNPVEHKAIVEYVNAQNPNTKVP